MEKEQIYQTIEAYLDGALGAEDKAAFEQELATDADLAREVELHRRLQGEFGDAEKTDLRLLLESIGEEFSEPDTDLDLESPSGNNTPTPNGGGTTGGLPFWMWGLVFFLVVGGGVTYYLTGLSDDPQPAITQTEAPELPTEKESISSPAETQPDVPASANESETNTSNDTPPVGTAPASPDPQVYSTNQELELLLKDGASKRYIFTEGNLEYLEQDAQGYLSFNAKLETSRSVEDGLFLSLYSNQYPEGQVLRGPLKFDEISGERKIAFGAEVKQYLAAYSGETNLQPALYYGVITVGESSVPLWVGKVSVE